MRLARLTVSGRLLLDWIRSGGPSAVCVEGILPADATIVGCRMGDQAGRLELVLCSDRFPEVAEGMPIPALPDPQFLTL